MKNEMYKDFVKDLQKKNKRLCIAIICISIYALLATILCFSTFSFTVETTETNEYDFDIDNEQSAELGDGNIDCLTQTIAMSENIIGSSVGNNDIKYLLIIGLILIIGIGVFIYDKSSRKIKNKS